MPEGRKSEVKQGRLRAAIVNLVGNRGGARRGVVTIVVGTLAGQLLLAVSTPFLSRLYPPQSFGVFSAIIAIASLIAPVATLKFESAILLSDGLDTARRLVRLSIASAALVSLLTGGVLFFLPSVASAELQRMVLGPAWVVAAVFSTALYAILSQTALRSRNYSVVATRSVSQAAGMTGGQLALSIATRGPVGLMEVTF